MRFAHGVTALAQETSVCVRGASVRVRFESSGDGVPLVFLHGFTGDSREWADFATRVEVHQPWYAFDLLGHGQTVLEVDSERPERYRMQEQVSDLEAVLEQLGIGSMILIGYSLGGRVALSYAVARPARLRGLVLESASPGLAAPEEQIARRLSDAVLAKRIQTLGVRNFIDEWERIPLFESQGDLPDEVRQRQRDVRCSQRKVGLGNSLLGMGTGSQPSLWRELAAVRVPTLLVTGELDAKFTQIAELMQERIKDARHARMQGVGHNVHLEAPELYWQAVSEFMTAI